MHGEHLLLLAHAATGAPADQIMRLTAMSAPTSNAAAVSAVVERETIVHAADARRSARRRLLRAAEELCRSMGESRQPMTSRIMATRGASAGGIA